MNCKKYMVGSTTYFVHIILFAKRNHSITITHHNNCQTIKFEVDYSVRKYCTLEFLKHVVNMGILWALGVGEGEEETWQATWWFKEERKNNLRKQHNCNAQTHVAHFSLSISLSFCYFCFCVRINKSYIQKKKSRKHTLNFFEYPMPNVCFINHVLSYLLNDECILND